jgi:CP family cyanate transporter-like MFS transporter
VARRREIALIPTPSRTPRASTAPPTRAIWWLAAGVFLVALNLRPTVSSVGPVLVDLRHSLGLSAFAVSVLTALPVMCFGALAPLGPWLSRRVGLSRAIGAFVLAVLVGLLVRVGPNTSTLFIGTLAAAAGMAALNVLLPVLIKRDFPRHTGTMMGVYTLALTGSASLAAGLTVPLQDLLGGSWRAGLGVWAVLAGAALIVWASQLRRDEQVELAPSVPRGLLRDGIAWMVTVYLGIQSLTFYAVLTWVPTLYEDHGFSDAHAGALLSLSIAVQVPVSLAIPPVAVRMRNQGPLIVGAVGFTALGLLPLLIAPTAAPYLWMVVLGIGQGSAFALALTLIVVRCRTSEHTQQLSAMAQGIGYLISSTGPLLVGVLHDATGHWTVPLVLLLAMMVPQLLTGLVASRPRFVGG